MNTPQTDNDVTALKAQIRDAFTLVRYPGDRSLRDHNTPGDEPLWVEDDFKDKRNPYALEPRFLDGAACGTALTFFSDVAFRFYLPAYLIADLDGKLDNADPALHLTHGLDDVSKIPCNPKWFGARTRFDISCFRFSLFTQEQAAVILQYLQYKYRCYENDAYSLDDAVQIEQAINNYWLARAADSAT